MDFEFSEEQEALRRSVREVLERECPPALARARIEAGVVPEQPWRAARELGWTAICVPEARGGLGLRFEELGIVVEEHGRFLAPGPFLATVTQFAPLVSEAGDDAQRARWLGAVAAGELQGAVAVAGPDGQGLGLDPSLHARPDGDGFLLEGERHWVLDGASADEIAVAAQWEAGDGTALFVLPRRAVKVLPVESLDGSRPLARLVFDGVQVGPERVLGTPGACAGALTRALEEASVALALETVGTCQKLLEIAIDYASQRKQFGQPIGAFQALQHKCADMFIAVEKARATAYFAMMAIAEDDPRRGLAASMAKAAAGDCERLVCRESIQIHGGIGFTWESDVQLFVKRATTGGALLGTAAEHRQRIAALLEV